MATAQELISQAQSATTSAQLDDIEAQAEGRVTVLGAVDQRRAELEEQPVSESSTTQQSSGGTSGGTDVEIVDSAGANEVLPDALGNMPEEQPTTNTLLSGEQKSIVEIQAEAQETGIGGMALPSTGEIAGGNISKLLAPPPPAPTVSQKMANEQAAMKSDIGKQIAGLIARPVTEWGVLGPGDIVKGHMLLLDLNSGDKVRAMDGHRINAGELYMNLRNVPEALSAGDTIEKVLG